MLLLFFFNCLMLPLACLSQEQTLTKTPLSTDEIFVPCRFEDSILRYGTSLYSYQLYSDPKRNWKCKKNFHAPFECFERIYNEFKTDIYNANSSHKIPKIIHQIWLGSPLPAKYDTLIKTWTNWHGWEYKLWTDAEVCNLELYNQQIYDNSKNYGEKSDILRLEILYKEGGLYVDIDFECLKPAFFDLMHEKLDLYAGIEPLEHGGLKICNAIMASAPGHPLIEACLTGLQENYEKKKKRTAIEKSGPNYVTAVINKYLQIPTTTKDVFFPPTYLYPTSKPEIQSEILYTFPESVAQHYWSGSWITH